MGREVKIAQVHAKNRDNGKRFFITEMPAKQLARWQCRAVLAIGHAGNNVPRDWMEQGIPGLLEFGLNCLMTGAFVEAEPLLEELLACCQMMPDPTNPAFVRPGGVVEGDIEEASTYHWLYKETLEHHLGFSIIEKWLEYQTYLAELRSLQAASQISQTSTQDAPASSGPDSPPLMN
jgi:hypothetical protein